MGYILIENEKLEVPGVEIRHNLSFERHGGRFGIRGKLPRARSLAVLHWGLGLNAIDLFEEFLRNEDPVNAVSSNFCVDNDGTVYQWLNPYNQYGFHAGQPNNLYSFLSFHIVNLVHEMHNYRYENPRPVIDTYPHGKHKRILGLYKEQILSVLRILKVVSREFPRFKLKFPVRNFLPVETVIPDIISSGGVMSDLHLSNKKSDIAGLESQIIALLISDQKLRDEFPDMEINFCLRNQTMWKNWLLNIKKTWVWKEVF